MADSRKHPLDEGPDSPSVKKQRAPDGSPHAKPVTSTSDILAKAKAIARAKAAHAAKTIAERHAKEFANSEPTRPASTLTATAQTPASSKLTMNTQELLAQIAARKARVAEAISASSQPNGPELPTQTRRNEGESRARGGLNVGVHPALLNDSLSNFKSNQRGPKFSSALANSKAAKKELKILNGPSEEETDPTKNPYYDPSIDVRQRERKRRPLEFNEKGKYIEQGNELRTQLRVEELKKRIQATSKSAGLDEEVDMADMALKREPPPDVEWWDQGLLSNKTYDDLDDKSLLKIDTSDSVITVYIQHPVPISAPWENNSLALKAAHLTKKEMKRIRKTERAERHKDKQDRIRLGLDPAPPPKVKLSNLMSVLTNEAIKDPTLVEARVRMEMEERKHKHVQDNLDRMLSPEQRHEKIQAKLAQDESKGIICVVFRIDSLANGQNRYKINVNARELGLKGAVIVGEKFSLVAAEGGARAIKLYKKLLLNRIDWTVGATGPMSTEEDDATVGVTAPSADLSNNRCELIFEGDVKQHQFRRWNVRSAENEIEAREILQRNQVAHFWSLAKNWRNEYV
ncbi:pre-mRNA processing factor 3-domain-containing protein [Lipomyces arxii]|uniref:pre-mRNA processing factor 3-domain-containing protein n=1 Tax=Lipomyces arxii TaxID=56418 RepID=UPI0034CD8F97